MSSSTSSSSLSNAKTMAFKTAAMFLALAGTSNNVVQGNGELGAATSAPKPVDEQLKDLSTAKEKILDYLPLTPMHDTLKIARDLSAIGDVFDKSMDEAAFERAFRIYSEGGHSESVAKLELREPLRYFIDKGTTMTGLSLSGVQVTGVALDDYVVGDKEVMIFYNQDVGCYVGGLPKPDTRGCFEADGEITVDGEGDPFLYYYSVYEDNINLRTIQHMSTKAEEEFKGDDGVVDQGWFGEFSKFEDYYGSAKYADEMVTAAFRGAQHQFKHHTYDFTKWKADERAWMVEHGPDFMNVAMHIVGLLERAKNSCVEGCTSVCNQDAIESLDTAVAIYTGSHIVDKNGEGNMLFALADDMCKKFKTCGWSVNATSGESHVNLLNMVKFKAAQQKIAAGQCESADVDMRIVAKMVFVPLWQGLLYAAYHGYRHEGTVFAAATLPILAHCSPGHVEKIVEYFLPNAREKIHFPQMKKIMEDHYHCTMLDCRNVGGLYNHGTESYHGHAEPCDQANIHSAHPEKEGMGGQVVFGIIGLVMVALMFAMLMIRRSRWNNAARKSGQDPDAAPRRNNRGEII